MKTIKTYSELITFESFLDRYRYLKLDGQVGVDTFGFDRYLNQQFYKLKEWKLTRAKVIVRDFGCDLGVEGLDISGTIIIHHINPITINDVKNRNPILLDPEYLISTQLNTHNAIHYGDESLLVSITPLERSPNDTKLW
jgi:hypothetical protein